MVHSSFHYDQRTAVTALATKLDSNSFITFLLRFIYVSAELIIATFHDNKLVTMIHVINSNAAFANCHMQVKNFGENDEKLTIQTYKIEIEFH